MECGVEFYVGVTLVLYRHPGANERAGAPEERNFTFLGRNIRYISACWWPSITSSELLLELAPARVQDGLRVAVGLLHALEDQVAGGLEGDAVVGRRHVTVARVGGI